MLPHPVGFPPKPENNAKVFVTYSRLYELNPELCEDEGFSITCKAKFDIPWTCFEAAFNKDTNILVWVNPDFYGKYLVVPDADNTRGDDKPITEFNLFGTGDK